MKSKQKRGADRLVRRMAKGVRPARLEVDCSGGELSSNGGSALLMMLAEQVRLFERVSACFTDHRDPSKVVHPLVALLGQRILGLALGYEDLNDHDELRRDRALSTAMGRVECARSDCEPLAGKSTLNRMELSANGRDPAKARQITVDFDALDELLVELYLVCGERGQMPKLLVLDIDATGVQLHGRQEHRFYHGYYHAYCYLPRLVFCNGWPVRTELRTSSGDVAAGVVETVEPLVDRLRKRFPQVPILIRADGAYCRDELMTWCEARGVDYVLGLLRNDRLKDRVQPLMDDLRDRLKRDPDYVQRAVRGYQSFGYRTRDSWSRERRVIAKAEWLPGQPVGNADGEPAGKADGGPEAVAEGPCATVGEVRYNSRFVVTSLQKPDAQTVYEEMYCDRGAAENWIKEQKNDRFLDRCSSGLWNVNALRLRLSRTGPCPSLHDEAPAREPSGILHAAPEPSIDAAQVPVPDPGARDGVHAADPSGVRIRLPVLEGFPLDLGQPGTNVKARCNRVHDAGGGARRPPRARMLSDSPSRPQKGGENTRMPALRSLFKLATRHSMPRTPRIP